MSFLISVFCYHMGYHLCNVTSMTTRHKQTRLLQIQSTWLVFFLCFVFFSCFFFNFFGTIFNFFGTNFIFVGTSFFSLVN